jgi:hypothetical protein
MPEIKRAVRAAQGVNQIAVARREPASRPKVRTNAQIASGTTASQRSQ